MIPASPLMMWHLWSSKDTSLDTESLEDISRDIGNPEYISLGTFCSIASSMIGGFFMYNEISVVKFAQNSHMTMGPAEYALPSLVFAGGVGLFCYGIKTYA